MFPQWLERFSLRAWFATGAVAAIGLVVAGMQLQEIYRLAPCPLCIFQRLLYMIVGAIALLGFVWPGGRKLWAGLIVAVSLGGLLTAAYQSWMQAFPDLAPECSYTDPNLVERLVDWLGMQVPSLFLATGFCTSRDWEFWTLSMANWSVLMFAGFLVAGVLTWRCGKSA